MGEERWMGVKWMNIKANKELKGVVEWMDWWHPGCTHKWIADTL